MTAITVEKNIPIPESRFGKGRQPGETKYPFAELQVGDSFMVPTKKQTDINKMQSSICGHAFQYKRKNRDTNFTTRIVDGGIRVWRIA